MNTRQRVRKFVSTAEIAEMRHQAKESLNKIVQAIDYEQTMLFTEGELLTLDKIGLRDEIARLSALQTEIVLNFQDFLVHKNVEAYTKKKDSLNRDIKLKTEIVALILSTIDDAGFSTIWKEFGKIAEKLAAVEETVFSHWARINTLMQELQSNGDGIIEAASSIVAASNAHVERSMRCAWWINTAATCAVTIVLITLGWAIAKAVNRSLKEAIDGLTKASGRVAWGADEISHF
jgi:hypothetical protein